MQTHLALSCSVAEPRRGRQGARGARTDREGQLALTQRALTRVPQVEHCPSHHCVVVKAYKEGYQGARYSYAGGEGRNQVPARDRRLAHSLADRELQVE